jgi:tRNA pseudouridine55 synthase
MSLIDHISGFVNINKPKNITSSDVVNIFKRRYKVKKCGHLGTLDPLATGVLPIAVNKATKIISLLQESYKEYLVVGKLGIHTDTFDVTGRIVSESNVKPSKDNVIEVVEKYIGERELDVPVYSAVKINGVRAYKLAREKKLEYCGRRLTTIYDIKFIDYNYPEIKLLVKCGKGTYIRSLVKHIGEDLKTYAAVSDLMRLSFGKFLIEDAIVLDLLNDDKVFDLEEILKPIEDFIDLPKAILKDSAVEKIRKGQSPWILDYLLIPEKDAEICAIFNTKKQLLCIAKKDIKKSRIPYAIDKVIIN